MRKNYSRSTAELQDYRYSDLSYGQRRGGANWVFGTNAAKMEKKRLRRRSLARRTDRSRPCKPFRDLLLLLLCFLLRDRLERLLVLHEELLRPPGGSVLVVGVVVFIRIWFQLKKNGSLHGEWANFAGLVLAGWLAGIPDESSKTHGTGNLFRTKKRKT